jgi:hypothetical protein
MRTIGLSPKLYAAVTAAVLGYLATQTLVTMPGWADLLVQVGLVAVGVFAAGPGRVAPKGVRVHIASHGRTVTATAGRRATRRHRKAAKK